MCVLLPRFLLFSPPRTPPPPLIGGVCTLVGQRRHSIYEPIPGLCVYGEVTHLVFVSSSSNLNLRHLTTHWRCKYTAVLLCVCAPMCAYIMWALCSFIWIYITTHLTIDTSHTHMWLCWMVVIDLYVCVVFCWRIHRYGGRTTHTTRREKQAPRQIY